MRPLSFFILLFFLVAPLTSVRAEYLQGTVVRVDRDRGEVEIIVADGGQCGLDRGNGGLSEESPAAPARQRSILVKVAWFPRCLGAGDQVYARGEFAPERPDFFEAEDVFPCRRRGGHDPTGVRSRFHHQRREMMRQMGGAMHE